MQTTITGGDSSGTGTGTGIAAVAPAAIDMCAPSISSVMAVSFRCHARILDTPTTLPITQIPLAVANPEAFPHTGVKMPTMIAANISAPVGKAYRAMYIQDFDSCLLSFVILPPLPASSGARSSAATSGASSPAPRSGPGWTVAVWTRLQTEDPLDSLVRHQP